MASPADREIGRVSIRVVPNTSEFPAELEAKLKALQKALKVVIDGELDATGIENGLAKVEAASKATSKSAKVTIETGVDDKGVNTGIAKVKAAANGAKANISIGGEVDTASVTKAVEKAKAQVKLSEAELAVKADTRVFLSRLNADLTKLHRAGDLAFELDFKDEKARQKFSGLVQFARSQFKIEIPTTLGGAFASRQSMVDALASVDLFLKERGIEVPILTNLDQATEVRALLAAQAIASANPVEVPMKPVLSEVEVGARTRLDKLFVQRVQADLNKDLANVEAKIKATPDFTLWRSILAKKLLAFDEGINVDLPVDVHESDKFRANIERLALDVKNHVRAALEEIGEIPAPKSDAFESALSEIEVKAARRLDTLFVQRVKADLDKQLAGVEGKIKVGPDFDLWRAKLAKLLAKFDEGISAPIPVNVAQAAKFRADILKLAADVKNHIKPLHEEVDIPVKGFVDKVAVARVESDLNTLERSLDINVPMTANGAKLLAEARTRIASLRNLVNLPVPMDLEGQVAIRRKVTEAMAVIAAIVKAFDEKVHIGTEVDLKRALVELVELKELVEHVKIEKKIQANVDTKPAERVVAAFVGKFSGIFSKLGGVRLSLLTDLATQLVLITARASAYVILLGPPILIALAGVAALGASLLTIGPILGAAVAGVAVLALTFKNIAASPAFKPIIAQVRQLRGELTAILLQGLDPLIANISKVFVPVVAGGLKEVATAMHGTLVQFLTFLSSAQSVQATGTIFHGLAQTMGTLGDALTPLFSAFQQITIAALPGFQLLADAIARGAASLLNMVSAASKSGALQKAITESVRDLLGFFGAVGRISGQLFDLLRDMEPLAKAVFGGIAKVLSDTIGAIDRLFENLQASKHPVLEQIARAIREIYQDSKAVVSAIIAAFAPLFTSKQAGQILGELIDTFKNLASAATDFGKTVAGVVETINKAFGGLLLDTLLSMADALDSITSLMARHKGTVTAFALVLTGLLLPALARVFSKSTAGTAIGVFLIDAARALGPLRALGSAVLGVGNAWIAAGLASLRGRTGVARMNEAVLGTGAALDTMNVAAGRVKASIQGIIGSLLTMENVATLGIAAVVLVVGRTIESFNATSDRVNDIIKNTEANFDPLKFEQTRQQLHALGQALQDLKAKQDAVNATALTDPLGDFWRFLTHNEGSVRNLANDIDKISAELLKLGGVSGVTVDNLQQMSDALGVTIDDVAKIAEDNHFDLSKILGDPLQSEQFAAIKAILAATAEQVHLTMGGIRDDLKGTGVSFTEFTSQIKTAMDGALQAFKSATSVIDNFNPTVGLKQQQSANEALSKAQQRLGDAQDRVNQLEAKQAASHTRTLAQKQAIERANRAVANAEDAVATAQKHVDQADTRAAGSNLLTFFKTTEAHAKEFVTDIGKVITLGLNPQFIADLLQAGPTKALPILRGLLSGSAKDNITLANNTLSSLKKIGTEAVEEARVVQIAISSKNAKVVQDMATALQIDQLLFTHPKGLTTDQIVKLLGLKNVKKADVQRIGTEFGLDIKDAAKNAVTQEPITFPIQPDDSWVSTLFSQMKSTQDVLNANPLHVPVSTQNPQTGKWSTISPWQWTPTTGVQRDPNAPGSKRIHVATGGLIQGPGGPTQDLVPAMLSNFEFVQRAAAVRYYGVDIMHAINALAIPRTTLRVATGMDVKMAAAQPSLPRSVAHGGAARVSMEDHEPGFPGGTMVLVDADGNLIGRMRAAAIKSHRDRAQASRMANLGTWGRS